MYAAKSRADIKRLLTAVLYADQLAASRYADLLLDSNWCVPNALQLAFLIYSFRNGSRVGQLLTI